LVDREDDQSLVANGAWEGRSLHDLWKDHRAEVFGEALAAHPSPRFPLLVKILDATDDLSIQVHPPAPVAAALCGEPKTEMWYVARAEPGAKLYVGLRRGVERAAFENGISEGQTRSQVHALEPKAGEFIFIPSGRLHAIGAGLLIYEIQQNSDTTYRVYDWDRPGTDGKPRELHVEASLQCIDFEDVEPEMGKATGDTLVECPYFHVRRCRIEQESRVEVAPLGEAAIVTVVAGQVRSGGTEFGPGDFFLVPAQAETAVRILGSVKVNEAAEVLVTRLPA
jgi:mannose-6-phosphate isomerase